MKNQIDSFQLEAILWKPPVHYSLHGMTGVPPGAAVPDPQQTGLAGHQESQSPQDRRTTQSGVDHSVTDTAVSLTRSD